MSTADCTEIAYREISYLVGYRIGSDGSVWSQRRKGNPLSGKWRKLKDAAVPPRGYRFVYLVAGDKQRTFYVHRLVLEAFVGPCPAGMQACHGDGNPKNNALSNLRWDTPTNNNMDKVRHGTMPHGTSHANVKLNDTAVQAIRFLFKNGWTKKVIAEAFGVCQETVNRIVTGTAWAHVA